MADIVLNGKTYHNVEEVMLPDGNGVYVAYSQGGGSSGEDGEDGGYYTPSVTQPDANTMQVAFIPSKADMPPVSARNIELPSGEDGVAPDITVGRFTETGGKGGVNIRVSTPTEDGSANVSTAKVYDGEDGKDYELTEDDKRHIAIMAAALVDVPTDDHINSLINSALGVIANASY